MFLTHPEWEEDYRTLDTAGSQSPQIGSMFLTKHFTSGSEDGLAGRNPLKSGQCFLLNAWPDIRWSRTVAIPSNRVNVSYAERCLYLIKKLKSRNPLKSGQCFLHITVVSIGEGNYYVAIPSKSGQCFLRFKLVDLVDPDTMDVAIPSNRVNVSYRIHMRLER